MGLACWARLLVCATFACGHLFCVFRFCAWSVRFRVWGSEVVAAVGLGIYASSSSSSLLEPPPWQPLSTPSPTASPSFFPNRSSASIPVTVLPWRHLFPPSTSAGRHYGEWTRSSQWGTSSKEQWAKRYDVWSDACRTEIEYTRRHRDSSGLPPLPPIQRRLLPPHQPDHLTSRPPWPRRDQVFLASPLLVFLYSSFV